MHCKGLLFRQCRIGIVNGDAEHLSEVLEGHTCKVETYGLSEKNDLRAENLKMIHTPGYLGIAYHAAGLLDMDVRSIFRVNSVFIILWQPSQSACISK